ncbi:hypothetical protein C2E25_16420 [Geothermobacter hydrogeniphilus]|uniref:VanZ-like domain-containing protein n=2 Tax=Geothermobacter hydrogeniphilus TaxID=1969733 RepID=A0A2K2H5X9_9BACT|nr:hypothetical protein C2E25_16420 [Geothermobacter hydrogeniphilus]
MALAAASLVVLLSCISQPTFESWYTHALGRLPLPDAARYYLINHYKLGHSLCYFLLTLTFGFTLRPRWPWLILAPFLLGVLLEIIQTTLPTRSGDWHDLLYNLAGIGVGVVVCLVAKAGRCMQPR